MRPPLFVSVHHLKLIVESDSSNVISWVSATSGGPWKLHFIPIEIKTLCSLIQVEFSHVLRSSNSMVLAKQGVDCLSPSVVYNL